MMKSWVRLKSWVRFMDDTFTLVESLEKADKLLEYLNKQHHSIKFTMEKEENKSINFLDVKIKRKENLTFSTSTYRKPTFTGVMLNWNSLTTLKYKKGLIHCLLDRSNKICSSEKQKEIEKASLRNILIQNNYPAVVIDKEYKKFEEKQSHMNVERGKNEGIKIKYLSLPYINDKSEKTAIKLKRLVKEYYNNIELRVAFKAPAELGSHFPFKDQVDDPTKMSNVVYYLNCKDCDASYIGKSTRICNKRMTEHNGEDKKSHVYLHQINENHEFDFENVKILDRASNGKKLELKEMLYIRKYKPSLNIQKDSQLFTFIIRNSIQENDKTRDFQKYSKKKPNNDKRK